MLIHIHKLYVNITMLHVNLIYIAYKGQMYATIIVTNIPVEIIKYLSGDLNITKITLLPAFPINVLSTY